MPPHISTENAKQQALPGSDGFLYSHHLYLDDLHRDSGVVRLNIEALKAFSDSITVGQRHELSADREAEMLWLAQGGIESGFPDPWGSTSRKRWEYINYEHLKIASAFELHLKSRLLGRNYVLHEIDGRLPEYKSLEKQQRTRPIEKGELFAIRPYHFDGKQNYLPGLRQGSLRFSRLTQKPAYRAALGLADQEIDIIEDYRLLRNQIHFPGDGFETPNIRAFGQPIIEFFCAFINAELIDWSNLLIAQHKMSRPPIARLT